MFSDHEDMRSGQAPATSPEETPVPRAERSARLVIVSLAVIFGLLGQAIIQGISPEDRFRDFDFFDKWPPYFEFLPVGVIFASIPLILAMVLFGLAYLKPATARLGAWLERQSFSLRGGLIGIAVVLALAATVADVVFETFIIANYTAVVALWLAGLTLYLAALVPDWRRLEEWRAWLKANRTDLLIVGGLTLVAAVIRLQVLSTRPAVISGDDGVLGMAALATNKHPLANPFALRDNFGGLYLQLVNLCIYAFGRTPLALRLLPTVGGILAPAALYALGRMLFGRRVALLAAALLAISHAHIHYSRTIAVGYIQDTLLVPLELYFLYSGLQKNSPLRLAAGGVILGFHFSIYLSAQIMAGLIFIYPLIALGFEYLRLAPPLIRRAGLNLSYFWLGMALAALPQIVYDLRHPQEFMLRLNMDGTFQSGWLEQQMAETGHSAIRVLFDRVLNAFLALFYTPSQDFYESGVPLLTFITAAFFLFGLIYALRHTRHANYLLLNGYLWGVTVAVGVFSMPPSADSYRMLIALPAAMLTAAIGWECVLALLTLTDNSRRPFEIAIATGMLALTAAINLRMYFVDFLGQCRYGGDRETRFASYLGSYLRTLDRGTKVYLLSDNVFYYGSHPSTNFLSGNFPVTNVSEPVQTLPSRIEVIIAPPSRIEELQNWLQTQPPGGRTRMEYDCENPILLAYRAP